MSSTRYAKPGKVYGPGGDVSNALTPRWYPLIPHPEHLRLINSPARFKVVPAGRRSGKTERAKRNLIIQALKESAEGKYGDYRYFAAGPTRDQAKQIFWNDLKAMIPKSLIGGRIRESELAIPLITGAEIFVVGLDRPQRMEGRSWNGGVIDEIASVKPEAWAENIRPALAEETAAFGDIAIDRVARRVRRNNREVHLGPTEYKLLDHLIQHPGRVFSREQFLDAVWGSDVYVEARTVDVHIGRLRKSLIADGERDPIRTVRSAGYSLDEQLKVVERAS